MEAQKIKGLKLSGSPLGWLGESLSFQLKEFRYALLSRIQLEKNSVLTVNLHLHHGPTLTEAAEERLENLVDEGSVPRDLAEKTKVAMAASVLRRRQEAERICIAIRRLRRDGDDVLLAGDFNSWGDDLRIFEQEGFINVTGPRIDAPSWDGTLNKENHRLSRRMASPFPHYSNPALLEFIRLTIDEPRMLDHILMSEQLSKRVTSATRILDQPQSGLLGSDHFGLLVTLG
jgi:endonuclease/exonuclease/phosphatase family metal-dependent hydrolase